MSKITKCKNSTNSPSKGLVGLLETVQPSEIGGSVASKYLNYQKDWAISKLLELDQFEQDYTILLDYHDDVCVLDSSTSPTYIMCYQVKGKNTQYWKISEFIYRPKKSNTLSIVGKLARHFTVFGPFVKTVSFISNGRYHLKLRRGTSSLILNPLRISDLSQADKQKILNQIQIEHPGSKLPKIDRKLIFETTDLRPDPDSTQVKEKLFTYLRRMHPDANPYIEAIYNTLFIEIKSKNDYVGHIKDFKDLISKKGITRHEWRQLISKIPSADRFESVIKNVLSLQASEGFGFCQKVCRGIKRLRQKLLADAPAAVKKLLEDAKIITDNVELQEDSTFSVFLNVIVCELKSKDSSRPFSDDELLGAAALYVFET